MRWSNGGKYLASGGDDRLVMVWGLSVAAGGAGKHKAETWRCLSTLRGHAGTLTALENSGLSQQQQKGGSKITNKKKTICNKIGPKSNMVFIMVFSTFYLCCEVKSILLFLRPLLLQ